MTDIKLHFTDDIAFLTGELTRQTLLTISVNDVKSLCSTDYRLIDLSALNAVDTAGLAWLFNLLEQAQVLSCQIQFTQLPVKLKNLIQLSGVTGLLPIK